MSITFLTSHTWVAVLFKELEALWNKCIYNIEWEA